MKYVIIYEEATKDLTDEVNIRIERGWKPIGGVAVSVIKNRTTFIPASRTSPDHMMKFVQFPGQSPELC